MIVIQYTFLSKSVNIFSSQSARCKTLQQKGMLVLVHGTGEIPCERRRQLAARGTVNLEAVVLKFPVHYQGEMAKKQLQRRGSERQKSAVSFVSLPPTCLCFPIQTRCSTTPRRMSGLTLMSHRACTACHLLTPGTQSPASPRAWPLLLQAPISWLQVGTESLLLLCL